MDSRTSSIALLCALSIGAAAPGQVTVPLPGRTINKLLPDYSRPLVYALNQANSTNVAGTLLALDSTNGAILAEIQVNRNPTDMAMTPAGDAIYVINAGSLTISKVDLSSFVVVAEKSISPLGAWAPPEPLHLAAGRSNLIYFTDGGWGPSITAFDYANGTNVAVYDDGNGAGGINLTRDGAFLYRWREYGWNAGDLRSWVTRYDALTSASLTPLESSFASLRRDPTDTPIFFDAAERWVFNKQQMFLATNVSVLVNQFSDNIYAVSLDGSIAFGPTEVFNTESGATVTNLPFSTNVQTLSGDQARIFRYDPSTTNLVIYDMAGVARVRGPMVFPMPANGSVANLSLTNLTWTPIPQALSYDVYFGTNQAVVAAATQGSPQYLGRVLTPAQSLSEALLPGATYYWRVDVVSFYATNVGSVWSFIASTLSVNPWPLDVNGFTGFNATAAAVSLTSWAPGAWTAAVTGPSWMTVTPTNGASSCDLTVMFITAALPAGEYTNNIEFSAAGLRLEVPVAIRIEPLNLVKMVADRERPWIYALQAPALSGQKGWLLFISATNGAVDNQLPIGVNPTGLAVHYPERKLYIASWGEPQTYVVDLDTQTLLPPLPLGTNIYVINAGRAGRIITEGGYAYISIDSVSTVNGSVLGAVAQALEGDGESDPTGAVYYHCDYAVNYAHVHKFICTSDTPVEVAASNVHELGARNLVLSPDGNRLFWSGFIYDTNLTELGTLGAEIYACSSNGLVAFSSGQAFDTAAHQAFYTLPTPSTVSVVDGQDRRFWYFDKTTAALGSVPMTAILYPFLHCPPNMAAVAPAGQESVVVNYPAPSATPGASVTNWPPPGSVFPLGDNAVGVTAAWGTNVMSCTFTISVLTPHDFGRALGTTNVDWTTTGDTSWFVETAVTHGGLAAAQSGAITNNQTSTLETTLPGPGVLSFWWKVSSETNHDFLYLSANGSTQAVISGEVDWQPQTIYLGSGPQLVGWTYSKDASGSAGQDAGWLDQVSYTPGPVAPFITAQPASLAAVPGLTVAFSVTAAGTPPLSYQWRFNGQNIDGATNAALLIPNVQASSFGTYSVLAANQVGTVLSADATLTLAEVLAWGVNNYGQTNVPASLTDILAVTGGWHHSAALTAGGTVVAWGDNNAGQTNVPANLTNVIAISSRSGDHIMALRADGTVAVWGDNSYGQTNVPPGLSNVVAIAAGAFRCLALKADSTAVSWGDSTAVPAGVSNVVAIAGGDYASLFLRSDGTVAVVGTWVPAGLSNIVAIAAGGEFNLALRADGTISAWGNDNSHGQTSVPPGLTNAVTIGAGDYHSIALRADGTVAVWGSYADDRVVSFPVFFPAAALPGLTNVVAVAAGSDHDLAIIGNGPPLPDLQPRDLSGGGGVFKCSLPTESGRVYRLEYKSSLADAAWTALPLAAGNGRVQVLSDGTAAGAQRFYRVRRW